MKKKTIVKDKDTKKVNDSGTKTNKTIDSNGNGTVNKVDSNSGSDIKTTVVKGNSKVNSNKKGSTNSNNNSDIKTTVVKHLYSQKPSGPDPSLLPGPSYPLLYDKSDHTPNKLKHVPNKVIAEVLEKNNHKISHAAKSLSVSHWTLKKHIEKIPELKRLLEDGRQTELEFVENKFMDQVKLGNMTAMIFYLKCFGRGKGWIEQPKEEQNKKPNVTFKYTLVMPGQKQKVIDMGTITAEEDKV